MKTDIAIESAGPPLLVKLAPATEAKASANRPAADAAMAEAHLITSVVGSFRPACPGV